MWIRFIALQFPAYYVHHPDMVLWLMHQHRQHTRLYDDTDPSLEFAALKEKIHRQDSKYLASIPHRYSMCKNVSNRLEKYNKIHSSPVYHPPANQDRFHCKQSYDYIFFPSRLEKLKRQDLLIKAMAHVKSPIKAIRCRRGRTKIGLGRLDPFLEPVGKKCV